jgi:hypothetical protein
MPSYKLTYFDAKARGEISRLIFAAAGVGNCTICIEIKKEKFDLIQFNYRLH